jgi:hypothetical protein
MCRRRSCCQHSRSQAPGVAAVAVIIGAGLAADKIGPHMARIAHDVLDVLRTIALITAVTVAASIAAWATARLVRWWLVRRNAQHRPAHLVASQGRSVQDERSCLACGGNGEVLRANSFGSFEPRACPECQPARLAG